MFYNGKHFIDKIKYRMKYHMDSPIWVSYIDKLLFKEYARKKGIETPKTLKIFLNIDEIDPKKLPNCAIKTNNSCGKIMIIKDSILIRVGLGNFWRPMLENRPVEKAWNECKGQLYDWLKPYRPEEEPQYKYIESKIFIEELLYPIPDDYKVFVFDGKAAVLMVYQNRFKKTVCAVYDLNWNRLKAYSQYPDNPSEIEKPDNLKELIEAAELLSDNLDFVRVDMYNIKNRILASELTLAPGGGCISLQPDEFDQWLFNLWNLEGFDEELL